MKIKTKIECVALACATERNMAVARTLDGELYVYYCEKWVRVALNEGDTVQGMFYRASLGRAEVVRGRIFIEVEQ